MNIAFTTRNRQPLRWLLWVSLALVLVALNACATGPTLTNHSFEFDAVWESPEAEVLNYRYGDSKQPGARVQDYALRDGQVPQGTGVSGAMLRGDTLYVKWRIKATGEVYEDTVDLKSRLPRDITNHYIHFVIKGAQLYVYLISPEKVAGLCPADTRKAAQTMAPSDRIFLMYCHRKIFVIYPEQPNSK